MSMFTPPKPADFIAQVRTIAAELERGRRALLAGAELLATAKYAIPEPAQDGTGPAAAVAQADDNSLAKLLMELAALPPSARLNTKEAAAYLGITAALLRTWRWKRTGPPYEGRGRFCRYKKEVLDAFMGSGQPQLITAAGEKGDDPSGAAG
jgi:hypothetical protein